MINLIEYVCMYGQYGFHPSTIIGVETKSGSLR